MPGDNTPTIGTTTGTTPGTVQKTAEDLFREADVYFELAEKSMTEDDLEKAAEYEAAGDERKRLGTQMQTTTDVSHRLETKRSDLRTGVYPAALPQGGTGGPNMDLSDLPLIGGIKQIDAEEYRAKIKSIYATRYGGDVEEDTIKVLNDLHGADYRSKRLRQEEAFTKYLRYVKSIPTREEDALLRDVVLGPTQVQSALKSGLNVSEIKATLVEAIDTLGGYIVPVDFQEEVLRRIRGMTVMRGRAATSTTSRDRLELPKLIGGDSQFTTSVRVTWVSEVPAAGDSATELEWGTEEIQIHTVMAETFLSRNLVEDAAVDLVGELTDAYGEAQAIDEDNRFLTGNGAGVPQGILINGTTPVTGVTVKNSGSPTGLTADGLIALQYAIASQYRGNAVWILNRASIEQIRKFKTGDGAYIWQDSFQGGEPANLLGNPVLEQEIMPAVAAGNHPVLFGDPRGYRIVDRIGMSVERFLDSETARRNRVLYVMRRRLGGQITHPERWAAQLIGV